MAKKGLKFLMNEKPSKTDGFLYKKVYRYVYLYSNVRTIIELEIYESNICVLKFFDKRSINSDNKYKLRSKLSHRHIINIFKACMNAFFLLGEGYSLTFSASNDIGKKDSINKRMSAYAKFLEREVSSYNEYSSIMTPELNTFLMYKKSFNNVPEILLFFEKYEELIKTELQVSSS